MRLAIFVICTFLLQCTLGMEEPLVEDPHMEKPLVQELLVEENLVEEPIVQEPLVEENLVVEPLVQENLVEEPLVEEPRTEEPPELSDEKLSYTVTQTVVTTMKEDAQPEDSPALRSHRRPTFGNNAHLKWIQWSGTLPKWAVKVFHPTAKRYDYICTPAIGYLYATGFYNPSFGPYCYSSYGAAVEARSPSFHVLVNEENLEPLKWMAASSSHRPPNPIKTHTSYNIFVGMSERGLGTAHTSCIDVTYEGVNVRTTSGYQLLSLNTNRYNQRMYDFVYHADQKATISEPPVVLGQYVVSNHNCHVVQQTVQLQESTERQSVWETRVSNSLTTSSSMYVGIPLLSDSEGVGYTAEKTYTNGNSVIETLTLSLTATALIPPNHSCTIKMVGKRYKFNIPFTAHLDKQYSNGDVYTTRVTGLYHGVQVGEIQGSAQRCQPIPSAEVCRS